jgi:hypothetical protein
MDCCFDNDASLFTRCTFGVQVPASTDRVLLGDIL